MDYVPIEIWVDEEQEERWRKDANELNISIFSYIRKAVDFYWETRQLKTEENICKN